MKILITHFFSITEKEYYDFVKLNIKNFKGEQNLFKTDNNLDVVIETDLNASYIMIDSNGYLVDDSKNDNYVPIINCLKEDFAIGLEKVSFNKYLYLSRYKN